MNYILSRFALFSCLLFLMYPHPAQAGPKTFIKDYTYQASEDDSRNSSRVIALREVKRLLLEELGTYLESRTEVKNFQLTLDQITTLTAGIVQTEIIAEKWDGKEYRLKSKITADPDKVAQSINELRKDREKTRELESMKQKSDELLREVDRLRKELASAKEGGRESSKAAYDQSIRELSAAEWIEKGHAVSGPEDEFKGAREAYSRAIELDPVNMKAYYFRARISEKNQAMSDYYRILSIEAKDSESHLIRAWTYKEFEQRDEALREFGKAIETAKGNKEKALAYYDRGRYYSLFGLRPDSKPSKRNIPGARELALQDFNRAIELDPTDPSYFHDRANSYLSLQKYDLAIRDLTTGIRLNPKRPGLYSARGQAYQFLKRYDLSAADLSRAIELEGPDDLFASHDHMLRAMSYEKLGNFNAAARDWTALIQKKPDDPFYYKERGDNYSQLAKYDEAVKDYTKSIALNPRDAADAYYSRALVYVLKGDSRKSIADLKNTLQSAPYYKETIRKEKGFEPLKGNPEFIKLLQ